MSSTSSLVLLERLALHDQDELRVARRAVVVHAELARLDAALAQRHALGVPERDHGVDLAGDQARHGREADRDRLDAVVVAAVVLDHGAQHRLVRGQAGHADALALEVARPPHVAARARSPPPAGAGRARRRPRRRCPASRARPRSWMSTTDMSARPAGQQLERVGARGGHADLQVASRRCRRGPRSAGSRARSCPAPRRSRSRRRRSRRGMRAAAQWEGICARRRRVRAER